MIFLFQGRIWADANYHLFPLGKTHWRLIVVPDKNGKVEYPLIDLYDNYNLKGKPVLSFTLKGVFNREGKKICHPSVFKKKSKALGKELDFTILKSTDPKVDEEFRGILAKPPYVTIEHFHGSYNKGGGYCLDTPWSGHYAFPLGSCSEVIEVIHRPARCKYGNAPIEESVFDHYELLLADYDGKVGKFETKKYGMLYAHLKPVANFKNVLVYPPDKKLLEKVTKENPKIKTKIEELKKCIQNFSDVKTCQKVGLGENDKMREIFSSYNKVKNISSKVNELRSCRHEIYECWDKSRDASTEKPFPILECGKLKYLGIDISGPQDKTKFLTKARNVLRKSYELCKNKALDNLKKLTSSLDTKITSTLKSNLLDLLNLEKGRFYLNVKNKVTSPFQLDETSDTPEYCFNYNGQNVKGKDHLFHTERGCDALYSTSILKDDDLNINICFVQKNSDINVVIHSSCMASPAFFIDFLENEEEYKKRYHNYINLRNIVNQ